MPFKKKYPPIPGAAQPPYIDWNKIDPLPDTSGIEFQDDEIEDEEDNDEDNEDDENDGEQESIGRFFSWLFGK